MYKEKLIELLKTVPEIKKDLEIKESILEGLYFAEDVTGKYANFNKFTVEPIEDEDFVNYIKGYIIGLEERHLRMYCENKGYAFAIGSQGKLIGNRNEEGSYTELQLDNTKSFDNQTEEVYGKILEFLENN